MKQIVQDLLPAPYVAQQTDEKKGSNKKTKPLMNEKQIDEIVQSAIQKDADVS
jgi:hypothetical protein